MAKASQVISFDKYTGEETSVEITQAEMEAGKEFVFTATDKEKKLVERLHIVLPLTKATMK